MRTCDMCGAEVTGRKKYCDKCAKYRNHKASAFWKARNRGGKLPEKYFYPPWAYDWFKRIEAINTEAIAHGSTYGRYMADTKKEKTV